MKQASMTCLSDDINQSFINQLRSFANEKSISDKDVMVKLFDAAYFLFRNEIAHTTNWEPLIKLLGRMDFSGRIQKFVDNRPRNATYQSTTSVTQILESISFALDEQIVSDLKISLHKFNFFSIMADEETNVQTKQVVSICVRYLCSDKKGIVERFLASSPVPTTDADTICSVIEEACQERDISLKSLAAISFDGTSNMSGCRSGVQALLKQRHCPNALFIHCRSHRLQLVLQKAVGENKTIKRILAVLGSFYKLFSMSPKRLHQLMSIEEALGFPQLRAIEPSPTRWLGYELCVKRVLEIYPAVLATLEHLHTDGIDLSSTAGGILLDLRKVSTIFILVVLDDLLRVLARLSKLFQTANENLASAVPITQTIIAYIENYNLEEIHLKCDVIIDQCTNKGISIESDKNGIEIVKKELQLFLSKIAQNLKIRFNDDAMKFLSVQKLFSVNEPEETFSNSFVQDICISAAGIKSFEILEELSLFRRWVHHSSHTNMTAKEIINELIFGPNCTVFQAINKLAVVYSLLPLGTATVERSFSTLNRIACAQQNRLDD